MREYCIVAWGEWSVALFVRRALDRLSGLGVEMKRRICATAGNQTLVLWSSNWQPCCSFWSSNNNWEYVLFKDPVSLKFMVSYTMDGETVTDIGEVEKLPVSAWVGPYMYIVLGTCDKAGQTLRLSTHVTKGRVLFFMWLILNIIIPVRCTCGYSATSGWFECRICKFVQVVMKIINIHSVHCWQFQ